MESRSKEWIWWWNVSIYSWCVDVVEIKRTYLVSWDNCEESVIDWIVNVYYFFLVIFRVLLFYISGWMMGESAKVSFFSVGRYSRHFNDIVGEEENFFSADSTQIGISGAHELRSWWRPFERFPQTQRRAVVEIGVAPARETAAATSPLTTFLYENGWVLSRSKYLPDG